MRERHRARVCRQCQAPLARQEDACWSCGTEWAPEEAPRPTLRLIPGIDDGGSVDATAVGSAQGARART